MKRFFFAFLAALLLTAIYWPGLSGGFVLDDNSNLLLNQDVQLHIGDKDFLSRAINSSPSYRDFARPLSMLAFAVEHATFGDFDAFRMKAINLGLHILNMLLLAVLLTRILTYLTETGALRFPAQLPPEKLALVLAFCWAALPGNVSSVLYVVQRMNLMASTFVLIGMLIYFAQRLSGLGPRARALRLWCALPFFMLGALCKENALLGWVFLAGLEVLFVISRLRPELRDKLTKGLFAGAAIVAIALPFLLQDLVAQGFERRPFGFWERLADQPYALLSYQGASYLPFFISPRFYMDYFGPANADVLKFPLILAAAVVLVMLFTTIYFCCRRLSVVCYVTLGWFFLLHAAESTVLPLEIAFQHRNYLPSVGLVLGIACLLTYLASRFPRLREYLPLMLGIYLLSLPAATALEASRWGNTYTFLSTETEKLPVSARAHYQLGLWFHQNDPADLYCNEAAAAFDTASAYDRSSISGFFGKVIIAQRCGQQTSRMDWQLAADFLRAAPANINNLRYLDLLSDSCASLNSVDCEDVSMLIEASLQNPTYRDSQKASFHYIHAKLALYQGNHLEAYESANRALEIDPVHLNSNLLMLDIMHETASCDGLISALDILAGSDLESRLNQRVGNLRERFASCLGG